MLASGMAAAGPGRAAGRGGRSNGAGPGSQPYDRSAPGPGSPQDGSGLGVWLWRRQLRRRPGSPGLPAGLPLRVIDMLRRQVPDGVPDDIKQQVRQRFDPGARSPTAAQPVSAP